MSFPDSAIDTFALDIHHGLSSSPKTLPCKYFYDTQGDILFQKIMALDEYYLTNCEREIFLEQKANILDLFYGDRRPFALVELGAGDGSKTKILLEYFLQQTVDFIYAPVDISANILQHLTATLQESLADLKVSPIQGDYFHTDFLDHDPARRKILLFLGSNIGNLSPQETDNFLANITHNLDAGDLLMIGFDLVKDPAIILRAYNDSQGVTKEFNLNLLRRINQELNGDFQVDQFQHIPIYDPLTGEAKSYLVSTAEQFVTLKKINQTYYFEPWEAIHTETSRKYSPTLIKKLAEKHHFKVVQNLYDTQQYYVNSVWQKLS